MHHAGQRLGAAHVQPRDQGMGVGAAQHLDHQRVRADPVLHIAGLGLHHLGGVHLGTALAYVAQIASKLGGDLA
ncbi:hypothetical protein D3C85_1352370 [compost metagenome]